MAGKSTVLTTTQNALSTSAEVVLASNSERNGAAIKNTDAAIAVYVGGSSSVAANSGYLLAAGAEIKIENYCGPLYAIAASGTPTITTVEW